MATNTKTAPKQKLQPWQARAKQIQLNAVKSAAKKAQARKPQEDKFEEVHKNDTDAELFAFVASEKKRLGKKMDMQTYVGYRYLVQRLGPWMSFMGKASRMAKEELDAEHAANTAKAAE